MACLSLIALSLATFASDAGEKPFAVPIKNGSFAGGVSADKIPLGWKKYGGSGKRQEVKVVEDSDGRNLLLISDGDPLAEVGVSQAFDLKGAETYRVTVKVRLIQGAPSAGAYLQLRFLPSNELVQAALTAASTDRFSEVSVKGAAPPDTKRGVIYLYTHKEPTPRLLVTDVKVQGGLPPPPLPPPAPVPPQYDALKDLCLDIALVEDGKPNVSIVAPESGLYASAAVAIQNAIGRRTAAKVPIVTDVSPEARVPIQGNLIVLGNRSTNKAINTLYDLYYCLVDLKYPGPEGYVVRSVHNPFGDGSSVLVVGGSDSVGVEAGAGVLARTISNAPYQQGTLSVGWTMATKLGRGVQPPTDISQMETWEASRGYGSIGYFGWCSISKQMAMYYMTGDQRHAREFVRLAFPDKQALRDIQEVDGERIENKNDPLAGFYHYNAHMAILFWDLIEESPVFSDAERLKITNAFARQLNHRKGEGVYRLTQPSRHVGSRHGQWSAIALYCLGRYFQKSYPNPVWAHCVRSGRLAFESLHEHAWIAGESDNLFWYNTGIAPIFTYLVLTGDRRPLENGVVQRLLSGQEALISGRDSDWALRSASIGFLNKAAYVTGDGRWCEYRRRTGVDCGIFRLGQSFWPDQTLEVRQPSDLVGKWTILGLPEPAWKSRHSGISWDESFYFGSYRSATDASGDFILFDGFNGASRNPYHTFAILQLRLDGCTVLDGYRNQVLTSADGMVEPVVAMDAALSHADVVGPTATAVGEVPGAAFCNWQRTVSQRTGQYALIVDNLAFRTASQNMLVTTTWQLARARWDPELQAIRVPSPGSAAAAGCELRSCDDQVTHGSRVVTMRWNGVVNKGERRVVFYLIGKSGAKAADPLVCRRIADNAAALALPEPAVGIVGTYRHANGDLVVVGKRHLQGHAVTTAGLDDVLVESSSPIDIDWDYESGVIHVVADQNTTLGLSLADPSQLRVGGNAVASRPVNGLFRIQLPKGRHTLTGASPATRPHSATVHSLDELLARAKALHSKKKAVAAHLDIEKTAQLPVVLRSAVGSGVTCMVSFPVAGDIRLAVAEGSTIHVLTSTGREIRQLKTDGKIRAVRWWNGPQLLLAGCVDEKVIAFDVGGRRKWEFTSKMDPAVYEAAKTYWFKTAPGHEGIHGLYTGRFDGGQDRCFVGSACTLEILDQNGGLVRRTPVFWGPGRMFLLVPGPDESRNLLISRWPNGTDQLGIVNSATMKLSGRGYYGVPSGHSYVGGWAAQNRTGLFHADLDGDGQKEVVTTINGTWNRVTVYSERGEPLHNAQFGPGPGNAPRLRMRDMDIGDLDGDGKQEILVGLSEGLVVALTHTCQRKWSVRLPSPPVSLKCVQRDGGKRPWVIVGCEDGMVVVLNEQHAMVQAGTVDGRPLHMNVLNAPGGRVVVLGTDHGEVRGFAIERP